MPTRTGWMLAAAAGASAGGGRLLGTVELFVFAAVAAALLALALITVHRPWPPLEISTCPTPTTPVAGAIATMAITVTNQGRSTPRITVHEPVAETTGATSTLGPLPPGATSVASYRLPTERRGLVAVGPTTITVTDPFGLARRRRIHGDRRAVLVLPAAERLTGARVGPGRSRAATGAAATTPGGGGAADLVTLRPYVVGDDLRQVHWRTSARTEELQVRRDESERRGRLTIVIDTDPTSIDIDGFERLVSAAASLVHAAAEADGLVQVLAGTAPSGPVVDARRNRGDLMAGLAVLSQDPAAPSPAERGRPPATPQGPVVVLTGPNGRPGAPRGTDPVATEFRFGAAPPGGASGRWIAVGPGETFASAWRRAAGRDAP